jgi:membrane-associated phospholipid phosphatase
MRWQEVAYSRVGALATLVAATLKPVVVATIVAGTLLGWLVRRRDLTVLALAALPATLAAEILLKRVVHRQWEGDPALLFPSGHAAMATAVALIAMLAVRVAPVAPRLRRTVVWMAAGYVAAIAVARLVETVHPLTDVLGGAALGLVVTLATTLAITFLLRRGG